ncbi:M6 family metalloprotease domain-containing protein [Dyadobacter sp. 3J3]|uniref:M6 family metalloprotease domain-containing protein n=1 Tax=Dyadobacter sp. 3J3 TaxID=2606600 RepID=UPI00135699EF|nr:M6 family metalloprotease domain-containing protein [Dyadobacter sp. 3J3]
MGLNDGVLFPGNLFPLGTTAETVRAAAAAQLPARGAINCLVVLIDFPGQPFNTPIQHYQDLFFSKGKIPTGSVREYYSEVSNKKIDLKGDVIGPFTMPYTQSQYSNGESGLGDQYPSASTMARDAAIAVAAGNRILSAYDSNRDGFIDAFILVFAGTGAEVTDDDILRPNIIWSHKDVIDTGACGSADGTKIYGYVAVPEDCKIGVCAHELGHLLFGFPDLYNGSKYKSGTGIGSWCLMSGGTWNNEGLTPAHPSAWCKAQQNWVTVDIPKNNTDNIVLEDVKTSFNIKLLWKNGIVGKEYFLIENRQQEKFDKFLPGAGLLIWHIDESMYDNTDGVHYKVALMQADGLRQLETKGPDGMPSYGDASDPYPGTSGNKSFTEHSVPNSISYGGVDSGVKVVDVTKTGKKIKCSIKVA